LVAIADGGANGLAVRDDATFEERVFAGRTTGTLRQTRNGRRTASHCHQGAIERLKANFLPPGADMTRVLVVDDDPMVCMAIEIYLERNGFEVTIADGGETGLRALEDSSFDLMIVDIFMPHMRGFESIRVFHERAPAVPLVAMSGYAFANLDSPAPDFLRMALELGAARCLRKPFTPAALLAVINECLADARSRVSGAFESR
jgi:CheY-like chemotaxis protein